jgi:hypothetical protein
MGSNKESKRHSKASLVWRTGLSGVPPNSVRCTREFDAELATFGKMEGHSSIIHRTVRCASGATDTSRATVDCNAFNARLRAQKTEHAQKAHRTIYRTCPVHHRTARWPHQSGLQRSEPNGQVTWLAHRTVRCAIRQQPPPTVKFGGWGYKYPNHPTFIASKFSTFNTLQEL